MSDRHEGLTEGDTFLLFLWFLWAIVFALALEQRLERRIDAVCMAAYPNCIVEGK